jgi:small-conductance mechanosensitive channel
VLRPAAIAFVFASFAFMPLVAAAPPQPEGRSSHTSTLSAADSSTRTATRTASRTATRATRRHEISREAVEEQRQATRSGEVSINDRVVFVIRVAQESKSIEARARAAGEALARAIEQPKEPEVHVEESGGVAVVYAGRTPIVQLTIEDARAAGDASIAVHAAAVSAGISDALRSERRRSAIANTVFSFSLLVFSGLIAFLVIKKLGEFAVRLKRWLAHQPPRLKPLRVGGVEVLSSTALSGGFSVAAGISRRVAQFGVLYLWLVVGLSMFESTRGYTERLTGFVLTPLSSLIGRIGTTLPLLIVGASAAIAVAALVRFVALFFGSVARGETSLGWLPPDLAEPTSILLRAGIILSALIFVLPVITAGGDVESSVGIAVLGSFGLASVPVLACAPIGIIVIFARRLRVGDYVEIGPRSGRITALTLLETRLEDERSFELRVPHLLALIQPIRVLGPELLVEVEVTIRRTTDKAGAEVALLDAARSLTSSTQPSLELTGIDGVHATYALSVRSPDAKMQSALLAAILVGLEGAGIELVRARGIPK